MVRRVLLAVLPRSRHRLACRRRDPSRPRARSAAAAGGPRAGPAAARRPRHRHRDHDGRRTIRPRDARPPATTTSSSPRRDCARRPRRVTRRRRAATSTIDVAHGRRGGVGVGRRLGRAGRSPALARHRQRHRDRPRDLAARQTETVADALRLVPGFSVVASGGRGALTSLFPRGGESDYTLVLVDGVAMNVFGGGFDAAHLSTTGIERIEVVRGPQSALFGGGAIGGIVQRRRRRRAARRQARRCSRAAARDTRDSPAARRDRAARGRGAARSNGSRLTAIRRLARRSAGRVSNDDYERIDRIGQRRLVRPRDSPRCASMRDSARMSAGNPGPVRIRPARTLRRPRHGLARDQRHRAASRVPWRSVMRDGYSIASSGLVGCAEPVPQSLRASRTIRPGDCTGRYQADVERRRAVSPPAGRSCASKRDNTYITGEAFQPMPVDARGVGLVRGSARADGSRGRHHRGRAARTDLAQRARGRPESVRSAPGVRHGRRLVAQPEVLRRVVPSRRQRVRRIRPAGPRSAWAPAPASSRRRPSRSRSPTIPSLKPERSRSVDAGIEHVFPGALVAVDATWFANRYDDLIIAVGSSFTGASRYRTDNIANARAQGVELGLRWQSRFGLSARAAYTWLDTEVLGVDDAPTRRRRRSPWATRSSAAHRTRARSTCATRTFARWASCC